MIVLHKNELYQLELPFLLFESWKKIDSKREVELLQLTDSNYKKQVTAPLYQIEDWSIARNLQALQSN